MEVTRLADHPNMILRANTRIEYDSKIANPRGQWNGLKHNQQSPMWDNANLEIEVVFGIKLSIIIIIIMIIIMIMIMIIAITIIIGLTSSLLTRKQTNAASLMSRALLIARFAWRIKKEDKYIDLAFEIETDYVRLESSLLWLAL